MNWEQLLSSKRFGMEKYHDEKKHDRTAFQRDYDRLVFSAPFRRLQNKTQVFPLPGSIFVHNRLTHSLEVSCVGRSLSLSISRELRKKYPESEAAFEEIGAIVAAACLAHDLGNPPFGHSGEKAISTYFAEGKGRCLENEVRSTGGRWEDFINFDGNSNSIRLLIHQFKGRRKGGFAMTYSMLASIVKYPYSSVNADGKLGFFQSEENDYKLIAEGLGVHKLSENPLQYARFPLVYLVEAADDICYKIMDIEDACKLHILSMDETINLFLNFFSEEKQDHMKDTMLMVDDVNEKIAYLRSSVIGLLVDECARIFLENEESILAGTFQGSLIKHISERAKEAYRTCTEVSIKRIYRSKDVLDIELAGHRIIGFLIEVFVDAIRNPNDRYSQLLLERIPEQYEVKAEDLYTRILAILDYISGMTDVYALDLYRKITGMSLPAV
ncbi:dGTP triphosphohydrolase [Dysgonomonas sp. 520]|uniref:dGTP triphosphohydrolase n=1 Tax=Dysgonomonas sp. 520 TaxID=2302931 RepID=UPI0013D03185|nr:dNTP triphosphohydrolase [Dysgonomonas sp. 520]NDW10673.1 dNTP triphosphohydrolase [Dysgonomonas sp. 520]